MHLGIQVSRRQHIEQVRVLQSDQEAGAAAQVRASVQGAQGGVTAHWWMRLSACLCFTGGHPRVPKHGSTSQHLCRMQSAHLCSQGPLCCLGAHKGTPLT